MSNEIWKDVVGYEGLYMVSNMGRVMSTKRASNKYIGDYLKNTIKSISSNKAGYSFINMYKDGKCKSKYVHRMVAQAFLPNQNNLLEVNHINGVKSDNSLQNLEWVSGSENKIHSYDTGLRKWGDGHHKTKIKDLDVVFIRESKLTGVKLASMFGVSVSAISLIKRNINRKRLLK